ncbi:MAG: hypothetical protein GKS00_23190 [Alphaproteobacteria bacterium]|nr:hypothetical protein [Alphaproteobacteria bacterium]
MRKLRQLTASCLLLAGLSACGGVAPFSALGDEDRNQLAVAVQKALEENKTGQSVNWANSKTGRRGTVTPMRTYKDNVGVDCREFQQTATVAGETDIAFGAACRKAGGGWRIVDAPSRHHPRYTDYHDPYDHHFGYGGYYGHRYHRYPRRRRFRH